MKIAFASSDGSVINQHFGEAEAFYVWELDPLVARYVDKVSVPPASGSREDKAVPRVNAISDCRIVCVVQIGTSSEARVVARGIHPVKTKVETPIAEMVAKLRAVLRDRPPPWLRKAMGMAPADPQAADAPSHAGVDELE